MRFLYMLMLFVVPLLQQSTQYDGCQQSTQNEGCQELTQNEGCPRDCGNFGSLRPMKNFQEERYIGTWYERRWYLADRIFTFVNDWIDGSYTYYTEENQSDSISFKLIFRDKTEEYCNDPITGTLNRIRPGVYFDSQYNETLTILWTDYHDLSVTFSCFNQSLTGCDDMMAHLYSKKKAFFTEAELNHGVAILKSICYPKMSQFIDKLYTKDCLPPSYHSGCSP